MKAVLFDLDGTLIDSAIQLASALNLLRNRYNLQSISFDEIRPYASDGAKELVKFGFTLNDLDITLNKLVTEYLEIYSDIFNKDIRCMNGIEALINRLNFHNVTWGIVTNKSKKFAAPIVFLHPLLKYSQCLIASDDVNAPKPSPEGLIKASQIIKMNPSDIIYLGDDRRDVIAANEAGMISMVARYGYLEAGDDAKGWGAQHIIDEPKDLLTYLNL